MIPAHRDQCSIMILGTYSLIRLTEGADSDHADEDTRLTSICLPRRIRAPWKSAG
jgi:hypothetical protein